MKKYFILQLLFIFCLSAKAQISYNYDASGNRIKRTSGVVTCPTLSWVNASVCNSGGTTKYHAEVSGLTAGQTAEFSMDGGAWTPANIGSNGIDYYKPGTSSTPVSFQARPQGTSCTPISGALSGPGSTCGTPICGTLNWINAAVCTTAGVTKFHAEVSGLVTGQVAEFSMDGGAWTTANYGTNGIDYYKSGAGSTPVSFEARIKSTSCSSIYGSLAGPGGTCSGARMAVTEMGVAESKENFKLKAYPNPVEHILSVEFAASNDQQVELNLLNVSGKKLLTKSIKAIKGANKIQLDLGAYPSGVYFVTLYLNQKRENIRVVKSGE